MSYQAKTQTLIKDPMDIILGSSIDVKECTLQNIIVSYVTETHYTDQIMSGADTPHHLQRLLDIIKAAFPVIIKSDVSSYSPTNTSPAQVLYNLGRMARESVQDDVFLRDVKAFEQNLRLKLDGTENEENSTTYARDVAAMWYAIGQGSDDMFGSWSSTQWRPIDDALAGLWITYFYIIFHWGVQVCTYFSNDYARGIGEYITNGGALEGRLKKLDIFNEADWPLRYLTTYNNKDDIFGITASMVDDPALKGLQIPLLDTVEPFIQKYFSRSRWLWRYMRWVDVSPIYTILPPKGADKTYPVVNSATSDFDHMQLFSSGDDWDWDWWNDELIKFGQKLQRFKFRGNNGAAFGKLKSRFSFTNVFDLPQPGGPAEGGLFWHQMSSYRIDTDVGGDDEYLMFKYLPIKEGSNLDYNPGGDPNILKFRRNKDEFYWYQLIGQIDLEMFFFIMGAHTFGVKTRNASTASMIGDDDGAGNVITLSASTRLPTAFNFPFAPVGQLVWSVKKDEDEGYYLDADILGTDHSKDYCWYPLYEDSGYKFFGTATSIYDWGKASSGISYGTSDNCYYSVVSLLSNRASFFSMRSSDPYKKLTHTVYDLNTLDAVAIRNVLSKTYLGSTPGVDTATSHSYTQPLSQRIDKSDDSTHNDGEIKLSVAPPLDEPGDEEDEEETKVSAVPEEVKMSVTPESVAKKEKELKSMKDQLAKDKKKEEAKKKQEAKK